jgi:hypothetical protein
VYAQFERRAGAGEPALHIAAAAFPALTSTTPPWSASAGELNDDADRFAHRLCAVSDRAHNLIRHCHAVILFPCVAAAGLLPGGQQGEGVMRIAGASAGYYRIIAAARGDEGDGNFGLAFFFVDRAALGGDELDGNAACLVVPGIPHAPIMQHSDLRQDAFAVPFGQRGLMSNLGLEGSRIFRIHPPY